MSITVNGNEQSNATSVDPDTVGSPAIIDGEVMTADIANGAVTDVKISGPISVAKLSVDVLDRANHTGTQLAATISDFSAAVQAESLAGDVTGTLGATIVGDDTHNHTLSTITDSGTAAALDVPAVGDAAAGQVVKGDDSRLTDARTPTAHTHVEADITDLGDYVLKTGDAMTGALTSTGNFTADFGGTPAELGDNIGQGLAKPGLRLGGDTILYRDSSFNLRTTANFRTTGNLAQAQGGSTFLWQSGTGRLTAVNATQYPLASKVSGRIHDNWEVRADGQVAWDYSDDGTADVTIENTADGIIALTNGKLQQNAAPLVGDDLTNKTYVDAEIAAAAPAGTLALVAAEVDNTTSSTTSTTYQTRDSATFTADAAKSYLLEATLQWRSTDTISARLYDTTNAVELDTFVIKPGNTGSPYILNGSLRDYKTLPAGSTTIELQYRAEPGTGGTQTIFKSVITVKEQE